MNRTPKQSDANTQQGPVVGVIEEDSMHPPFPDMGPNPVDNQPKKAVMLGLVGIIVVLVFVAGYLLFFLDRSVATLGVNGKTIHIPNTAASVQSQFMIDMFAGNMKGAYGLTSSNFKKATSESSFTNAEKYLEVSQLSTKGAKQTVGTKNTVIDGSVDADGVHIFGYSSRMVKQGDIWKVDNIVIQS